MIQWIFDPFAYAFMQRGFLAAIMVGILCAVIGCFVVLRGMAFLGDAMAHAILPGVAIAYLLQGNLLVGALIAAVVVALGISLFSKNGTIKEDTAIGIFFAAALSLGVALISGIRSYAVDLSHILFGNVLGVSVADLWMTGILSLIVIATIIILYKPFMVISFDPILAATLRMPANLLRSLLLVLIALTVVVSMQTVGVGLVAAMLVTPGATAYLLTRTVVKNVGYFGHNWCNCQHSRSIPEFLPEHRFRGSHCALCNIPVHHGIPFCPGKRIDSHTSTSCHAS